MMDLVHPDPMRRPAERRPGRIGKEPATVALTDRALRALVELRAAEHALPGQALGLVVAADGSIGLVLDLPGGRDQVFSSGDVPILFVEAEMGSRLAGRVLDHAGAPGQERFALERLPPDENPPARVPRQS